MIKRTLKVGLATAVAAVLFTACQKETMDVTNSPQLRPLTAPEEIIVAGANEFAFESFAQLRKEDGTKNIFISPLSISMALGMTYNGAEAETKDALRQTLGFGPTADEEINKSFKDLSVLLKGIDKKVQFTSANSLWHDQQYTLQAPFVNTSKTYFDATVKELDFSSPAAAKEEINNWVKSKTNGKIEKIVEEIRREHVMFLINAIYFKGTWTYPFDKQLTKPGPFRLEDGSTVTHDFMTMKKGKYRYYQDASKEVIDLPYGNQQYSMTLLVPKSEHKVQDVVQELNGANLSSWLAAADTTTLELQMPKFRMEYDKTLNDMLRQLGMGIAFGEQADFSRMVEGRANLAISEVKHKTFVEVNEEGTEAAAATSVGIMVTSLPPTIRIDKPFVFLIREKSSNAILFIGQLMRPE